MQDEQKNLSFFQMVGSVLASFFGVQSSKNRERDFKRGKAKHFIMVGVFMTVVWYGAIYCVVQLLLSK
jgi:hypothetical protein